MPPPPRKMIKQIAWQSKLNFSKSKSVLNFISFECQKHLLFFAACSISTQTQLSLTLHSMTKIIFVDYG